MHLYHFLIDDLLEASQQDDETFEFVDLVPVDPPAKPGRGEDAATAPEPCYYKGSPFTLINLVDGRIDRQVPRQIVLELQVPAPHLEAGLQLGVLRLPGQVEETADPTGVELADQAKKKGDAPHLDMLDVLMLAPQHVRVTQVQLMDRTDVHNELVFENEWLLLTNENGLQLQGNFIACVDRDCGFKEPIE